MPVTVNYPGVYVQEVTSGVHPIVGVGTSIAMFIGRTRVGEPNKPVECWSYQDFECNFGAECADSDVARAVRMFFMNGGTQCYVTRIDNGPTAPGPAEYEAAYLAIEREVDRFNLMVLPKDAGHSDADTRKLWGPASVFCQQQRAFLLIDPPSSWTDSHTATDASGGVDALRVGLVADHSAVFFPCLTIDEGGNVVLVGPSGAIAGLMARIDATGGVWSAAAGIKSNLRGVSGVERKFTAAENGVLNKKAVNTLRVMPNGIVSWGARTMAGDDRFADEYKYIPIRRLALFIEDSLYRSLQWVVFEPNDDPLWAQIRLNVDAFMHDLFRQGAFQGATPKEAYFAECDSRTTTQNDINLGIVNIVVGFAPLKPAEFVVLRLQQMAGHVRT